MADEEHAAGVNGDGAIPAEQGAGQPAQAADQDQPTPQGSEVGSSGQQASSAGKQPSKSNSAWATERIVEKAIKRHLETSLSPILEKLNALSTPAAPQPQAQDDLPPPDYNNLNQWLATAVEKMVQQKLQGSLPRIKQEVTGELKSVSKTQEARNYLLSQEDIAESEDAIGEIEQIMKRELLEYAAVSQPLKAVRKAVEIWRREKKNPSAPPKEHLLTVAGGVANRGKKEMSIQELVALQNKIASGLTIDEQDKIFAQVDTLVK